MENMVRETNNHNCQRNDEHGRWYFIRTTFDIYVMTIKQLIYFLNYIVTEIRSSLLVSVKRNGIVIYYLTDMAFTNLDYYFFHIHFVHYLDVIK